MASICERADPLETVQGRNYPRMRKQFYRVGLYGSFCAPFVGGCDKGLYQEKGARI